MEGSGHILLVFLSYSDLSGTNFVSTGVPYQLDQLASNQPKLSAFFTLKSSKMSSDAFANALCRAEPDAEDSSVRVEQSKNECSSKVVEMIEFGQKTSNESDETTPDNTNEITMEEPTSVREQYCEVEVAEGSNADTKNERDVQTELETGYQGASTSASSHCLGDQKLKECPSSAASGISKQSHSTFEDPNFAENYFKVIKLEEVFTFALLGE